ncbi:MAG TPA: aminoacyl-tRNA hydrolase [Porphyromonadaceae bacterium]|nr:aminoacyl-tRNA hydrolase [Porphyromonadaceae bacterium]
MKYLVVGLGNIGEEYVHSRHNIGFRVLDALAKASNLVFSTERYGDVAELRVKGQTLLLLKPSTYMNLSGNAVKYWMDREKVPIERLLIIADDLALPFGTLRMKPKGSSGGHNGLKNIESLIGSSLYARLRIGIGNDFSRGKQIDFVLGKLSEEEEEILKTKLITTQEMIKTFALEGVERAMTSFNNK